MCFPADACEDVVSSNNPHDYPILDYVLLDYLKNTVNKTKIIQWLKDMITEKNLTIKPILMYYFNLSRYKLNLDITRVLWHLDIGDITWKIINIS